MSAPFSYGVSPTPSTRIAVFVPSMHGGGAERAMLMFCAELVRRGSSDDSIRGAVASISATRGLGARSAK